MSQRIFIYIRLRVGERVLYRSKIREFAGLGSLLADFRRGLVESGESVRDALEPGTLPALEYVDAQDDEVLISFVVDPVAREQVVSGRLPAPYRERMLDPGAASYSTTRFVARAAPEMTEEQRASYARRLASSGQDVMSRIRKVIDPRGWFELRLPLD